MQGFTTIAGLAAITMLAGCASSPSSRANIDGGVYSGVTALGQSITIEVSGDHVRVNSIAATFPDATTNAVFAVALGGAVATFTCTNGDNFHTLSCSVRRSRVLEVKVPCNLLASPPPSATPAVSPTGLPSASAAPVLPRATTPLCPERLPQTETVTLLHLCTSAPCPDQTTQ
ncbi:MAG: hypothetical protein ACYDAC_06335 [Candidatus Dormibacteria bacterium]